MPVDSVSEGEMLGDICLALHSSPVAETGCCYRAFGPKARLVSQASP